MTKTVRPAGGVSADACPVGPRGGRAMSGGGAMPEAVEPGTERHTRSRR